MLIWRGPCSSNYQDVTFASRPFSYFHSAVTARPISIETKSHCKSNIAQSGAIGQMRRGSDISHFLSIFCSQPHEELTSDFQPIPIFEKEPHMPVLSLQMTTAMEHGDSPWPIILVWTAPTLGHLLWKSECSHNEQRMKCRGLLFKINGVSEAK